MESAERDDTQDWLLPKGAAPPLLGELEERIDEALIIAKASEKAAIEIGDAALDAAAQARRAAELAERASEAALSASATAPEPSSASAGESSSASAPALPERQEDPVLRSFSERADRVVERLRALEQLPIGRG